MGELHHSFFLYVTVKQCTRVPEPAFGLRIDGSKSTLTPAESEPALGFSIHVYAPKSCADF